MTSAIMEWTTTEIPELHLLQSCEDAYRVVLWLEEGVAGVPEVFALERTDLQQLSDKLQELADTYGDRAVRYTWSVQPWCTDIAPSLAIQHTHEGLVLHVSVLRNGQPRRLKLTLAATAVADVLRDLRRSLQNLGSRTAAPHEPAELDIRQDACLAAMWLMG